jgi:hypothetical protein
MPAPARELTPHTRLPDVVIVLVLLELVELVRTILWRRSHEARPAEGGSLELRHDTPDRPVV